MANTNVLGTNIEPVETLETLIINHGPWLVIRALITALPRAKIRRTIRTDDLSDHLRQDVGLPPQHPPPMPWHTLWRS